jgi:hypothetical protein
MRSLLATHSGGKVLGDLLLEVKLKLSVQPIGGASRMEQHPEPTRSFSKARSTSHLFRLLQ